MFQSNLRNLYCVLINLNNELYCLLLRPNKLLDSIIKCVPYVCLFSHLDLHIYI